MKFSILIPAYKPQFLSECIESVLAQTFSGWELVIVNDASPYDINSIVEKYNDSRIRYFKNEIGFGAENVVDNWNKCLSYAEGEYVICMGDDDRLLPCCLEEYNLLIERYQNLDVYHARTELINENGEFIGLQEARPEWESAYSALWHLCHCGRIQYIGDFLFRIAALKNEGGFYKLPLAIFSDNISTIRAAKKAGIANTQKICFQYRTNRYTITSNGNPRILAFSIKSAYDWFLEFLEGTPIDDIDKKYQHLLLNGDLKNHLYGMMMYVIGLDLQKEGLSAISYWEEHYKTLNIEKQQIRNKICSFRKEYYKNKIKRLIKK